MKEESISDKYFELLSTSPNSVAVLVSFLREVLEIEITDDFYGFIGRLIKLYGKEIVFSGILTLATSDIDSSSPSSLKSYLSAICRRLFMEKFKSFQSIEDLTPKARKIYRRLYGRNQ
ncbi:MAG: hypothetical protein QXV73_05105 [Candidatus Micrarchaeia archaeon]